MMQIEWSRGRFPAEWERFFAAEHIPHLKREGFYQAFFASEWDSVLVRAGSSAMLHSLCTSRIPGTDYFDAESWLGYGGPLFNEAAQANSKFPHTAIDVYRRSCAERRIVAESIRFDPATAEHEFLQGIPSLSIGSFRDVVLVPLKSRPGQLHTVYRSECARRLRKYRSRYRVSIATPDGYARFWRLHSESLTRVGAAPRWFFSERCLNRLLQMNGLHLLEVSTEFSGEPVCAAVIVLAPVSHSLLVGNLDPYQHPSSCDVLMDAFLEKANAYGASVACLGGGGTTAPDDSLLRYKLRFSKSGRTPLHTGLLVHDDRVYSDLVRKAHKPAAPSRAIDPIMQRLFPYRC